MKTNNGITIVALMITVLVLMLLSGVTINVTSHMQEEMKLQEFKTKLDIMQTEVIEKNEEDESTVDKSKDEYIHYGTKQLEEMGFTMTDQDAWINWKTRASTNGI